VVVSPGVGKSHLAIALGIKSCKQGVRTLFVAATALITTLGKAPAEGKLDERLKLLSQPQLLIIDEIGYLPIDRQGANLFFQLAFSHFPKRTGFNEGEFQLTRKGGISEDV
jgi:DNA replication protein DnaC